jgi:ABC-2 type transport system permease protein
MRRKPYRGAIRNEIQSSLAYRGHFLFGLAGTVIYLVIARFLWKAVFAGSGGGDIGGVGFGRAYLYVGISMSLAGIIQTSVDWSLTRLVTSGDIFRALCRPQDLMGQLLAESIGDGFVNCAVVGIPALVLSYALSGAGLPDLVNVIRFIPAVAIAFFLNFLIDFITGLSVFALQSSRGVMNAKDTAILVFSGALVPLPFYPAGVRSVLEWLPFQALYNAPARILADGSAGIAEALPFLARQAAWAVLFFILARLLFSAGQRKLVVNGG